MVGARPITTSMQTADRNERRQLPAGEVPQHAADDRHDHRAGIADGEHAGGDAVDVLGRADQRRQRQNRAPAPRRRSSPTRRSRRPPIRRRGTRSPAREARQTTPHSQIGPHACAPSGPPRRAAGTTPGAGRVLSAVSARVDQVRPPGVGQIVRQEAVQREIGGVDAAEQEADPPDHRIAEVRHPAAARGGRRRQPARAARGQR